MKFFFFTVSPLDCDVSVAEAADVQIGVQIFDQIVVRGRQQRTDSGSSDELAQIERQDFGQSAIQHGGKLIGQQKRRAGLR